MAKKIKKYKVGLDSETMAISLVTEPAIEVDFISMSKDEEEKQQVFLEKNEKYLVYGPALIPDKDIYRNNGEQEYYLSFTKESIEKMSQDYMKDFKQYNVSLQHEDRVDEVCVVESWIVADSYRDKSNALGFNVPEGTWMVAMKVNNIDTWNKIKSGELKGFSVESMVSLEEFNKVNDNNMEVNDSFWSRLKATLFEALGKEQPIEKEAEVIVTENGFEIKEELEEEKPTETPVEETPSEASKEDKPTEVKEEPKEEPKEAENKPEEVVEEPKKEDNHLEELLKNLQAEITALKEVNSGLQDKIKDLSKQPSAKPVSTTAKPNPKDTYAAWRETMRGYLS